LLKLLAAVTLAAAIFVAAILVTPAFAFDNTEPLADKQWYLGQDNAWSYWPAMPKLFSIKVAVIDTGIDGSHPDLMGRVVEARSFVGGSPYTDQQGHGTFIAGLIAASPSNNEGIAGMAFNAQLMIAKVVGPEGTISLAGEVAAIRWAVDHGARVINLSLGGVRDPLNPQLDTYSPLEQAAVEYAYSKGVVVVAAVGNGPQSPATPWKFAHYPAALPHVIGVSALTPNGSVPNFSDRDRIYNDISAPGQEIYSTLPRALTSFRPLCPNQGYSDCGPDEFRHAAGTSFAAPQVTAAAAVLLALKPTLQPDQVGNILERSATDVNASNGCKSCPLQRDSLSGWGRLDVSKAVAALDGVLPAPDRYEPNDDAGPQATKLTAGITSVKATIDFWDDNIDVYRVYMRTRQKLTLTLNGPAGATSNLLLWKPGTKRVNDLRKQNLRAAQSIGPGTSHRLGYRIPRKGWYYVEVKVTTRGSGPYELTISRSR
jgi:subtilisin family serine protease